LAGRFLKTALEKKIYQETETLHIVAGLLKGEITARPMNHLFEGGKGNRHQKLTPVKKDNLAKSETEEVIFP